MVETESAGFGHPGRETVRSYVCLASFPDEFRGHPSLFDRSWATIRGAVLRCGAELSHGPMPCQYRQNPLLSLGVSCCNFKQGEGLPGMPSWRRALYDGVRQRMESSMNPGTWQLSGGRFPHHHRAGSSRSCRRRGSILRIHCRSSV